MITPLKPLWSIRPLGGSYYAQEKAELLRKWITSGENLSACEQMVKVSRKDVSSGRRRQQLVAVKDMAKNHGFSECLISTSSLPSVRYVI